ncbi:MAG TPA: Spy/CpxP family protein refolding chaperone [Burkholderiales bacterium]|nr:Spy/CpxP family protein refolding chaperone [Burkholderiales bacterium]
MKDLTPVLGACLLAGSLALGVPASASADDIRQVSASGDWRGGGMHHRGRGDRMMRMLRGLDLSEAQRDQIFQIRHAQAPAMRAQMKAVHAARKDLRELALAPDYDAAKAQASADALARATSQMALMRIDMTRKVLAVLTPEQRQQLEQRRAQWRERRGARS